MDNIIVYDFDGILFSIEVTNDMCRKYLSSEGSWTEDIFSEEEHLQKEFHGETYPDPEEITVDQMNAIVEALHETSLKCTEEEISNLIDIYGDKFKKYRNQ